MPEQLAIHTVTIEADFERGRRSVLIEPGLGSEHIAYLHHAGDQGVLDFARFSTSRSDGDITATSATPIMANRHEGPQRTDRRAMDYAEKLGNLLRDRGVTVAVLTDVVVVA